jgi:hypothetical protein
MKIYPYPTLADGTPWVTGTTAAETGVRADYTRLPAAPNWSYVVINNKPLYTPTGSVHFELHAIRGNGISLQNISISWYSY